MQDNPSDKGAINPCNVKQAGRQAGREGDENPNPKSTLLLAAGGGGGAVGLGGFEPQRNT